MDEEKANLIKRIRTFIRRLDLKIHVAYLFGSRTGPDYLHSSDVDLVLVSEGFEGQDFFERMAAVSKKWNGKEPLEALCYTPKEFEKKKNQIGIVREAVRTGILIVT